MNQKRIASLLIGFLFLFGKALLAQSSYWIFFTDKKDVSFNPYEYFDAKAIERRMKNNIPLNDPTDWPLNETYVSTITNIVDSVSGQTRWFNALAVRASEDQIIQIKKLKFVKEVQLMEFYAIPAKHKSAYLNSDYTNQRKQQLEIMGWSMFKKNKINGKGVRIAIFDGGFPGVNTSPAFEQIRNDNRLIKTWDFTKGKENVFYSISHGTMVMSNIGGLIIENGDTAQYGLATGAEFMLAKTEVKTEPFSEEKNWLMAVEWADKNGADIINSSLGYTKDRYFKSDMDGKTSLVSRAGNMAARKGILVVNAAGNEGIDMWHTIGAPADADSVLSIGGINPKDGYHIDFSSYGPTADGRMKPNVCAFGNAIVFGSKMQEENVNGTSFASPLVAGFAACALQANPKIKNMELFHLIEKSGHLYPYFDYAHGFGIPQAEYVITKQKEKVKPNFTASFDGAYMHIKILDQVKIPIGGQYLMYINFKNKKGIIKKYLVVAVYSHEFDIETSCGLGKANEINIFFNGYYSTIKIK